MPLLADQLCAPSAATMSERHVWTPAYCAIIHYEFQSRAFKRFEQSGGPSTRSTWPPNNANLIKLQVIKKWEALITRCCTDGMPKSLHFPNQKPDLFPREPNYDGALLSLWPEILGKRSTESLLKCALDDLEQIQTHTPRGTRLRVHTSKVQTENKQ